MSGPLGTLHQGQTGAAHHIGIVLRDFSGGGSERVAIRLANRWAAAGRRVTLYAGTEEGVLRALVEPDVTVRPIFPWFGRDGLAPGEMGRALGGMVRGDMPDVLVGPGNSHITMLASLAGSLDRGRPPIVCKISNPLFRHDRSPLAQAVFGALLRRRTARFDRMVAMSPALAAEAAMVLRRHDIACVAEPTLEPGATFPLQGERLGTVLCIGRLEPQKNFTLALEVIARMTPERQFIFLGEGAEHRALAARAAALGLGERALFAGHVADVRAYLEGADALLCTSRYEGYPAALVEALAAGVPVVTTACSPAMPEIMLDPSFGSVVADASPSRLAGALSNLLAQGRRPAAEPLGVLRRRHDADRAAAAWLALLDEAAERQAPAAPESPLRQAA